ncbi:MAG: carbohydrate ABC transporter substrate-binding protein [Candidatus Tectomicrobia bacterium]|nr:carbohydrate ABC transporter substrate-binding protein [Candidatus Tectomicrobia bacterium]
MKVAGAGAAAATLGPAIIVPGRATAQQKTLRILQWNHFVPGYDKWFNETYVKEWGQKNNTNVIVDNIGIAGLNARAAAEVRAQQGHDLFLFLWPPPVHEDQVIDHREIYEEVERKHGKAIPLAIKSTYNPKTKKYYGFSDSYVPDPINYRKDLWDAVGVKPDSWEDIRVGGAKIKKQFDNPVGIGLASEIDTNMAMRSLMYSWGSSEQDENGKPILGSKQTVEAVKFVKALYQETMTPEVFSWDASSNNRFMLAGKGSLALNAISVTRTGENEKIPVTDNIWLAKAAAGPVRRIGLEHVMDVYCIWKFAKNIEGAKKFLVDYVDNFKKGFLASEYYNFPCFTSTVPDLKQLLANDPKAKPSDKYKVLEDVESWATNVGYPGYANAAIDEVFSTWIVSTMFAKAAQGIMSPEDAVAEASKQVERIFQKWSERGKL